MLSSIPHSALRTPHSCCRVCGADLPRAVEDLVRCPRCRSFQVLSLPDDPAYRLVGRHRWVRFLPYLTVFLFWFALVVTFRVLDDSIAWGMATLAMTLAAWFAAVLGFRRACGASPGWGFSLAEFHIASGVLLAASYHGLKSFQAVDTAGWQAVIALRPALALVGVVAALALSIDALRRGDAIRLRAVPSAECAGAPGRSAE